MARNTCSAPRGPHYWRNRIGWRPLRVGLLTASLATFALCNSLAFWAGTRQEKGLSSEIYALQRIPTINANLREAVKGFAFLAGDSHVELVNPTYRLCGWELVNGGISGAKAELYRELTAKFQFDTSPDAVILTIGTNNLLRKKDPLSSIRMNEFEESVRGTLATFRKVSKRIIVTALPPVSPSLADRVEIQAVSAYSERLRAICARESCEFVDPFQETREADLSSARPGTMWDGLHLTSYRNVSARLGRILCPGFSQDLAFK